MNEQFISLDLIDPNPYQPRQSENFDDVLALAMDILHHATDDFDGLMQVPTVRQVNGHYQLAFGHTRKAAFEELLNQGNKRYKEMRVNVRELTDVQMFELAVAENIKRRDLNPIEQAEAMRRYMDEFKKTSIEAGEFFGVAEETVRQKVRLLNLPEPVKVKMRAGEVNENTARALLSMQRVASPEKVAQTVEKIEKEKGDKTAEQVIQQSVQHLGNVEELWNESYNNGKPMAGRHGWPLDMKRFPNHLLPAMTEEAAGAYEAQLEHLNNPPACSACPFYTRVRGSHFCGLKICYQRKTIAWHAHQIEQATKNTGIKIYSEEDGPYRALSWQDKALFEKKHKDLRLVPNTTGHYVYQDLKGVNDDLVIVVATGSALGKLKETSGGRTIGKKTEAEKAEMRRMRVYRLRRKEFLWEFTAVAKIIFDGVPVKAVKELRGWKFVGIDDSIPNEWLTGKRATAETEHSFECRELIWGMLHDVSSHYRRSSMATILKKLQEETKDWGIKIPARITRIAEQFDAEIEAAAAPKAAK